MTDPPKKTRKNGKRGSTMGETIFKEEGKLVRPGRGLTPPLIPPYALLTEGKVKRAKRSGKRLEPATRKRMELSDGVRSSPPPKGPPPREEESQRGGEGREEKPVCQEARGREKKLAN